MPPNSPGNLPPANLVSQRLKCPNCGTEAVLSEIVKKFGLRTVGGETTVQSWCRSCRNPPKPPPERA